MAVRLSAFAGKPKGCRYIPGDEGWPMQDDWAQLNRTVGGRLIATVPQASVCHSEPYFKLNNTACAVLQDEWGLAQIL